MHIAQSAWKTEQINNYSSISLYPTCRTNFLPYSSAYNKLFGFLSSLALEYDDVHTLQWSRAMRWRERGREKETQFFSSLRSSCLLYSIIQPFAITGTNLHDNDCHTHSKYSGYHKVFAIYWLVWQSSFKGSIAQYEFDVSLFSSTFFLSFSWAES